MRTLCAALLAVSACVQSSAVDCGDGRVCPDGYTCKTTTCASPAQIAACDGMPAGTECSADSRTGRCFDGACEATFCGNGIVEPGEACDDNNQLGGDGCNGTCTSTEVCGNGIVELDEECDSTAPSCGSTCKIVRCGNGIVEGVEVCDDGNNSANDGCSPLCDSIEVCGNGTLDFFSGEQCDDGNTRNLDGCNAACQVERIAWSPNDPETVATPP